jgi:hypothetical protein
VSFIKKAAAAAILLGASGYIAHLWEASIAFEATGKKLISKLGRDVVEGLGEANRSCLGRAMVDSIAFESDWPLAQKGTAVLYISGSNGKAISLEYRAETSGEKVYVKPKDAVAVQQEVYQFALNDCG